MLCVCTVSGYVHCTRTCTCTLYCVHVNVHEYASGATRCLHALHSLTYSTLYYNVQYVYNIHVHVVVFLLFLSKLKTKQCLEHAQGGLR